jgi:MFS family permease
MTREPAKIQIPTTQPEYPRSRWKALIFISLALLLGMSPWFSASALIPELQREWSLSDAGVSWLTLAVQLGFVFGTLISSLVNLPDILNPRLLMTLATVGAAGVNAALALWADGSGAAISLRFATGMFLAGVYPPAMKVLSTWFRSSRGLAIGILIAALTVGKASPYLINALAMPDWRSSVLLVSGVAMTGAVLLMLFVSDGPCALPPARFDFRQAGKVFSNRGVRLANFGYFGHMWELYAMWTWVPVMIHTSLAAGGQSARLAEWGSFLVIGAGALGCVVAGKAADRVGRTLVTSIAMVISGICCLLVGFLFHASPAALLTLTAIWGAAVVADSAQFSTCITELGDPQYLGTALTLQTCLGFLLTMASMRLIPFLVGLVGWEYAFASLAVGPVFGVVSMLRLRRLPEAARIAHGRR